MAPVSSPLAGLGCALPVLAAPMAGGPGTPALVIAAAAVGGLGFLAAGYKPPQAVAAELAELRSAGVPFGINLFAPNPVPVDADAFRRYATAISAEGDRYGLDLASAQPAEDDDHWADKIDLLLADPVPVASFTFGLPDRAVIAALRKAGTLVAQTVTSAQEAQRAAEAGADLLVAQAAAAGGHWGTLTPAQLPAVLPAPDLVTQIRHAVSVPCLAAGGLATRADVTAVLRAGAAAAIVGTLLLRAEEAGTSAVHRAALADPARTETVLTRAFTGRPARGLRNRFIDRYDQLAPSGYPALHHLTSPLRKAAAAAGDPELVHLWAGTGWRQATEEPAGQILARLAGQA
jgi:NAD(P)H-dependent flavin oxidoreductase YrpB (nitropropane dioxygenase family)